MPYGNLTPEMKAYLEPLVRNRLVWDLGAGIGAHALQLRELGADVLAVDKAAGSSVVPSFVGSFQAFLDSAPTPAHLSFISWPVNYYCPGLAQLVRLTPWVVYLGLNSAERGMACGGPGLWGELFIRPLHHFIDHPSNSMLVYAGGHALRELSHPEELEAFRIWTNAWKEKP